MIRSATFGFTLVELLVVIAIIGILGSVAITNLNSAKAKARDAQRLKDMEAIVLALKLYYEDNESWPDESTPLSNGWESSLTGSNFLEVLVTGGYLSQIPLDPINACEDPACTSRTSATKKHYMYDYFRYDPGNTTDCDVPAGSSFYILGIRNFESSSVRPYPTSPGLVCGDNNPPVGARNFNNEFDWVVSNISPKAN